MAYIIKEIRQELKDRYDEKTQKSSANYSKEKIKAYGVKMPIVAEISKDYFKLIKEKSKAEIFDLCEKLWASGYIEESFVASKWSYSLRNQYEAADFETFEKWIDKYVSNWASCDTFCNNTIGAFLQMYPEYLPSLKRWARSTNRWMRRAAAVSLIVPARKGAFLKEIFEIADILLTDKDDLVQKGYGWMLKVASKPYQKEVFDYVMTNKAKMPRTALRYAIEKMPPDYKADAMAREKK